MDAVIWAVDAGVADADRVAIMGASYGGYAVLAGLTFTPTFFAAGVDLFGPAHVGTLLESMPAGTPARALFERRIGQVDEPDELDLISPLMRMDEIRRPLLIGQGGKDRRAPETETLQILQTLQGNGVPVACMVFPDEGHAFTHARNALAFFALTEAFLARHLGGRAEPPAEAVRASGAKIIAGEALLGESG